MVFSISSILRIKVFDKPKSSRIPEHKQILVFSKKKAMLQKATKPRNCLTLPSDNVDTHKSISTVKQALGC